MKRERSTIMSVIAAAGLCSAAAHAQGPMKPILGAGPAADDEVVLAPVIACFAEGTNPIYARRVEAMVRQMNMERFGAVDYQLNSRWSGSQGSPRALTWSFVPDGLNIPSGVGEPAAPSNLFAQMDAKFAAQGGRATWIAQYTAFLARWQALSGLSYTRITVGGNDWDDGAAFGTGGSAGLRGDLRFSGKNIDGGSGVLAYNFFPANGDMVLDTSESWGSSGSSWRFLRNTLAHEHGHGMGLNHVDPTNNTKLMEAFLNTNFDGPQQDDIRGAQRHYGDPFEANDTAGAADPIGALAIPGSIVFGNIPSPAVGSAALLSIDANGESDFWSFTVTASCLVTATATPVGSTYLQGPQGGATANVNALAQANLAIEVLASNGTTILGSSSSAAVGAAESVVDVGLPSAGTYYVRVFESDAPTQSQLYRLTVAATGNPVCPQITQNPSPLSVCEFSPVSFSVIATGNPAPTYQWRRNLVNVPGATSATYSIPFVSESQEGSYDCVVTNSCTSVTSTAALLTVWTSPVFTGNPGNQSVALGAPASFSVTVTGDPAPGLQWRKNNVAIGGATSATYNIASVTAGDAGTYDCVATNTCDLVVSSPATLTITGTTCYANCDSSTGSPVLTANDFQCFLNRFAANESYANCDASTGNPLLTANDFQCFLNSFAAGCS